MHRELSRPEMILDQRFGGTGPSTNPARLLGPSFLAIFIGLSLVFCARGAINAYQFDDPAEEQRFRELINELRCPKCQNQNIADSDAPLSNDLRQRVYDMMQDGHDNGSIVEHLVERYGTFVTYRPPLSPTTWVLWFGPAVALMFAALIVALWIRRRGREPAVELTDDERRRLEALLESTEGENDR